MYNDTYNFKFIPHNENDWEQPIDLTVKLSSDAHISEIHRLCKLFALTLGYDYETVEEYFGETRYID